MTSSRPSRQLDGVRVSGNGIETFDRCQHVLDMNEGVVESTWIGIMLGDIVERLTSQDRVHGPGVEKVVRFSKHHVVHHVLPSAEIVVPASNPLPFISAS